MTNKNIVRRNGVLNRVHAQLKNDPSAPNIKKSELNTIYNTLIDEIIVQLETGNDVHLTKFMSFESLTRKAYRGCNPKTGEMIDIPEKRKIRLRPMVRLLNVTKENE